jgi:hypothetical protein
MSYTVETNNALVAQLLEPLEQPLSFDASQIGVVHNEEGSLHMLGRPLTARGHGVELFGFFTPASLGIQGATESATPEYVDNVNTLEDLPEDLQKLSRVSKGVGARLYNTYSALAGWHDFGEPAALYGIKLSKIYDARSVSDHTIHGRLRRIAAYGLQYANVRLSGLPEVVDKVHAVHHGNSAVLLHQPPKAEGREWSRGYHGNADMPETLLLVRDRSRLHRVARLSGRASLR